MASQAELDESLAGTFSYGTVPPSFDKLGMVSTIGITATSTGLSTAIEVTTEALKFAKAASRLKNPVGSAMEPVTLSPAGFPTDYGVLAQTAVK